MQKKSELEGWRQHEHAQRLAWLRLSYLERLRWLDDAKEFVARAQEAARQRGRGTSQAPKR